MTATLDAVDLHERISRPPFIGLLGRGCYATQVAK